MQLHVQSEALGGGRDLHRAGDSAVLVGAGSHVVRAVGDDEVHVLLQEADVFRLEDGSSDHLSQLPVGKLRDAAVLVRVLQPEEAGLVARPADCQRVCEGLVLAGGIDEEGHAAAHAPAHGEHVVHLALDGPVAPAVDLERPVAHLVALFGEVCELLGRAEAAVVVAVQGAGVGG